MKKEFVPHAESYELKELGFDELCLASWNFYTNELNYNSQPSIFSSKDVIQLPTFSQAFYFFREKYEIAGEVNNYYSDGKWLYNYDIVTKYKEKASDMFDKHEEAELACLKKLIEIVKNK